MKKISSMLAVAIFITLTSFANPFNGFVNPDVTTSFAQRFKEAKEISWSKSDNYVKAQFELNNRVYFAYFTPDGEYLGQARNIRSTELPINLQAKLKNNHAKEWITELFEYSNDTETVYFIILENGEETSYLKSDGSTEWAVYKKIKKA